MPGFSTPSAVTHHVERSGRKGRPCTRVSEWWPRRESQPCDREHSSGGSRTVVAPLRTVVVGNAAVVEGISNSLAESASRIHPFASSSPSHREHFHFASRALPRRIANSSPSHREHFPFGSRALPLRIANSSPSHREQLPFASRAVPLRIASASLRIANTRRPDREQSRSHREQSRSDLE